MSRRNSPYAESTSGASYGLPDYSYVLGNAGNKKGTASGDVYYIAVDAKGRLYGGAQVNNAIDITWEKTVTKDDLLISVSDTGPTDWTALETTGNMPFKIWNVTKASTSKGAPAGCYEYGTLIALVATTTGDRWRNTLIYIPDSNSDNKIYIRNGRATKWLAFSGTKVDSVS